MKAKKKLLIGTAIMALAAGGASAVSTFAWYQASTTAGANVAKFTAATVETQKGTKYEYTTGTLTFNLVLSEIDDESKLVMAHWDSTGSKWEIKYVKADGTLIDSTSVTPTGEVKPVKSKAYSVGVYASRAITDDDIASMTLENKNYLSCAVGVTNSSGSSDDRINYWTSPANSALDDDCNFSSTQTALKIAVAKTISTSSAAPTALGYVAVSYEGQTTASEGKYTADTNAPSIKITLSGSLIVS